MLAGAVLSNLLPLSSRRTQALLAGLGPAGVALVGARFYTFDPYYLPTMRRFSEGGFVSPEWIFGIVAAGVLAGALIWREPELGVRFTGVVLVVGALTLVLIGGGH